MCPCYAETTETLSQGGGSLGSEMRVEGICTQATGGTGNGVGNRGICRFDFGMEVSRKMNVVPVSLHHS